MRKLLSITEFSKECFKNHQALVIDGYYCHQLKLEDIKPKGLNQLDFCFTENYLFFTADALESLPKDKISLREFLDQVSPIEAEELAFGAQILNWDKAHRYCGTCGNPLVLKKEEVAKLCKSCDKSHYPQTQPVAIMLVKKGDELLLAKGLAPRKHYSCLAGFIEAGETVESCVRREVMEEVGVEVENIRYFGSQSWPFPNNLMMAFVADWKAGEIKIDPNEITDAAWFSKKKPPEVLPPKVSISRQMIDSVWA